MPNYTTSTTTLTPEDFDRARAVLAATPVPDWIGYDGLTMTTTVYPTASYTNTHTPEQMAAELLDAMSSPIPKLSPEPKNGKDNAKGFARWIRDEEKSRNKPL